MRKEKVLILGYFGFKTKQVDGQTIKTQNIYRIFKENNINTDYFDTQTFKFDKLSVFALLRKIVNSNKIVYLPAHKNLKYIFPILFLICKFLNKDIYYFVIGGWLFEFIKKNKRHVFFLKRINGIFTETDSLNDLLKSIGFKNVCTIPNFKFQTEILLAPFVRNGYLVFFSRLNKMKGLSVIFKLLEELSPEFDINVHFYGPINSEDKDYFFQNLSLHKNAKYCGVLNPDEIVPTLSSYQLLLFPTKYYTEGLPGVILDAYYAKLPIIATDWQYAREFIEDTKTGMITTWDNPITFISCVRELLLNPQKIQEMRNNIGEYSKKFSVDNVWEKIEKNVFA